jgi:hypothetical protein
LAENRAAEWTDVGHDGQGNAIELVSQEEIPARKASGQRANAVGKGDGLLVDLEFLERECHGGSISPYPNSRKEKVLRQAQDK